MGKTTKYKAPIDETILLPSPTSTSHSRMSPTSSTHESKDDDDDESKGQSKYSWVKQALINRKERIRKRKITRFQSLNVNQHPKISKKRLWTVCWHPDVLEVIASLDFFRGNINERPKNNRRPSVSVFLMEAMRTGIHTHNWLQVSKCVEGLAEEFHISEQQKYWIIWNGGFLALVNTFRNDFDKVAQFALYMRKLLRCYPRRLGIEVATFFTQKGYFRRGVQMIRDLDNSITGKYEQFHTTQHGFNCKRYQFDLIRTVFFATEKYAYWKRDTEQFKNGTYDGELANVREVGQEALYDFKQALELAEKADADVTIFIEPLIELLIEFETEFAARAVFLKLVENNPRNFVLEALYLKFIEKYFMFLDEEYEHFVESRKMYNWRKVKDLQLDLFKFRNWKDSLIQEKQSTEGFNLQPLPKYSI